MVRVLAGDVRQAVFSPLDDGAQRADAVVRRLGSAIALGLIEDGEQLPSEMQLAVSLGVSTMTLREALADLRRRGLVVTRRGRAGGSFVRAEGGALAALTDGRVEELGTTDLREIGELHAAIAGAAALHAAERATEQEIEHLSDLAGAFELADEVTARRRVDGRFYIELAASAQSVRLTMQEIGIQTELGQLPWALGDDPVRFASAVESQRAVVRALRDRDANRARSVAEAHIGDRVRWLVEVHMQLMRRS